MSNDLKCQNTHSWNKSVYAPSSGVTGTVPVIYILLIRMKLVALGGVDDTHYG